MKTIKYFFQFIIITFLFLLFKILGLKISSSISGKIFQIIGPFFRSKKLINENIKRAFPKISQDRLEEISKGMWNNYGKIFAEYMFLKNFRLDQKNSNIIIEGQEVLDKIKSENKPVVFISGHFSNFELMAMQIEKSGIKLSAIYRPLNNKFLNTIMENIRIKFICKKQIKKGIGGIKELVRLQKKNYSIALMIDQRVTEGIESNFFSKRAFTTTIPAQLVKKFNNPIVPIFIERIDKVKFKITIHKPLIFANNNSTQKITDELNKILEKMILQKPEQWIWTHNRWK
jgi:KDO2-lipid IV(A) lauroyltransferase